MEAKTPKDIIKYAHALVIMLGLSANKFKNKPELIIDKIISDPRIDLRFEVIPDSEWRFHAVNGLYDPVKREIKVPNRIWKALSYKSKSKAYVSKKIAALKVILHELGHYFLSHEFKYFNEKSSPATENEDAEYQADTFADAMLFYLGIREDTEQLRLF